MAVIEKGSTIGVKFTQTGNVQFCSHKDKTGQYCIHNGRFMYAKFDGVIVDIFDTTNINRMEYIVINHAGHCENNNPKFKPLTLRNVKEVELVPSFNYSYSNLNVQNFCKETRPPSEYYEKHKNDPNLILPTFPIAFCFKANGGTDTHNGRYMFWEDDDLRRHCVLNRTDKPKRIWYSHMVFDNNSNLKPELRYRDNITGFKKIPPS